MKYLIRLTPDADEQLTYWQQSGQTAILIKLDRLFQELELHPTTGIGKPERLKGNLSGFWSRRITKADRMVYEINGDTVVVSIISLKGHYSDK